MVDIKKLIGVVFIFACFAWTATATADSKKSEDNFKEVVSGRYYLTPKSVWLEGISPLRYQQVFWFIEASGLSGAKDIELNSPIQSHKSWETLRKAALKALVQKKLLTEDNQSLAHPREFYLPDEWSRSVQQQLLFRANKTYSTYCKATLVIRAKRYKGALGGDLKWWDEFRVEMPTGECN